MDESGAWTPLPLVVGAVGLQSTCVPAHPPSLGTPGHSSLFVSSRQSFSSHNVPPRLGVCAHARACMSVCQSVSLSEEKLPFPPQLVYLGPEVFQILEFFQIFRIFTC